MCFSGTRTGGPNSGYQLGTKTLEFQKIHIISPASFRFSETKTDAPNSGYQLVPKTENTKKSYNFACIIVIFGDENGWSKFWLSAGDKNTRNTKNHANTTQMIRRTSVARPWHKIRNPSSHPSAVFLFEGRRSREASSI